MATSSIRRTCSSLAEDILIEIFTYLPLNSIYRFKCLSKVWLSKLSNPNFMIKWFQMNNKSIIPWILYYSVHDEGEDEDENGMKFKMAYPNLHSGFMSRNEHLFSLKFLINQKPLKVLLLGSSNGLVLSRRLGEQCRYEVCNPLTQTWVSLPLPPLSQINVSDFSLIFFEYSSLSFASCYKVLRIPQLEQPSKNFNVDIFCSKLGAWESFQVSCDENVVLGSSHFDKVVIRNGVMFWIEGGHRLLVYNLNQKDKSDGHRCSLINLPDEVEFGDAEYSNLLSCIGESEGWVCYAKTRCTGSEMTVSVWVLNKVNWQILQKDISLEDILTELGSRTSEDIVIQVLGFSLGDRNAVLLGYKNWVWRFNIQTRSFEELCLDKRQVHDAGVMFLPFVLKPMPTVLPPPSWMDT